MNNSPLISYRFAFHCGSAHDPSGKEGLACLTARLIAKGSSATRTYKQILDEFFEMATGFESQVDKELTVFFGTVHRDHAQRYEAIIREMLDQPAFLDEDLERVRSELLNALTVELRGSNDEELAKEMLYASIYDGHPYRHPCLGTVAGLTSITSDDVRDFLKTLKHSPGIILPPPSQLTGIHATLIEKPDARGVAMSFGHPIEVLRGHPDYHALLLVQSWLGQHRNGGRLFDSIREVRGLNYGDYAYIEYFPRGMYQFEPDPNLARHQQIFEVWLRPVEPSRALFALRLALYEIASLQSGGISQDDFERTRNFLIKYVKLRIKTESLRQGYAIDSEFYGIGEYTQYMEDGLRALTLEQVNAAARKYIDLSRFCFVAVGPAMASFAQSIQANEPSTVTYEVSQPEEVLAVDREVATLPIALASLRILGFEQAFER